MGASFGWRGMLEHQYVGLMSTDLCRRRDTWIGIWSPKANDFWGWPVPSSYFARIADMMGAGKISLLAVSIRAVLWRFNVAWRWMESQHASTQLWNLPSAGVFCKAGPSRTISWCWVYFDRMVSSSGYSSQWYSPTIIRIEKDIERSVRSEAVLFIGKLKKVNWVSQELDPIVIEHRPKATLQRSEWSVWISLTNIVQDKATIDLPRANASINFLSFLQVHRTYIDGFLFRQVICVIAELIILE